MKLLLLKEAPYVLALLVAAASWSIDHVITRVTRTPLLAYEIQQARADDLRLCTGKPEKHAISYRVPVELLGSSTSLRKVRFDAVVTDSSGTTRTAIAKRLCWIGLGSSNPDVDKTEVEDMNSPSSNAGAQRASHAAVTLDQMQPGDSGVLIVPLEYAAPISIRFRTDGSGHGDSAKLVEEGIVTALVRYETGIFLGLFLGFGAAAARFLCIAASRQS
jgi:hypothetical protein